MRTSVETKPLTDHVTRCIIPTPTLPPAYHTNSYLIQDGEDALLVDAGTHDADILDQIAVIIASRNIHRLRIAATHYHRDHTHGLPRLADRFHAPIYIQAADLPNAAAEMNVSASRLLAMPASLTVGRVQVHIHPLPGHTHGHVHLTVEPDSVILVGDHLAGEGSVWIGPPDGHLSDYLAALDAIAASGCKLAAPGHGDPLEPAADAAIRLKERRLMRDRQIVDLLAAPLSKEELVDRIYGDTVPPQAIWVAVRTVQSHLQRLQDLGRVQCFYDGESAGFRYRRMS